MMISRKAEATLNSKKLFDEAHKLSSEACHVFPATWQDKVQNASQILETI